MKNLNHSPINPKAQQKRPQHLQASFALSSPFSAVTASFIPATLSFAAGILWSETATVPISLCWILIAVLATRIVINLRQPSRWASPIMLLALFFIIGGVHSASNSQAPPNSNHILNHIGSGIEASIVGKMIRSPQTANGKTYLLIKAEQLIEPNSLKSVNGLVRLAMQELPDMTLRPGDDLVARARLAPVSSYGVPGAFNYKAYLNQQNIWVSGWVPSPLLISKINSQSKHKTSILGKITLTAESIRHAFGHFIDKSVPKQAGLYKSILIGDRSSLTKEYMEHFKASGAIHLLAISGLHMGLLAVFSTLCLTWLLTRSQWIILHIPVAKSAALISLIPLTAYALIAGFHTPAIRSLIMVAVFVTALVFDRQWNIPNNLAIAALLLLAITPSLLFTVSFQLSFAAVAAIAIIPADLSRKLQKPEHASPLRLRLFTIKKWLFFSVIVSMAASIGTAPILLWHFNRVSLISTISTLLIEPFLCLWALMLGLLASLFVPWWEHGAAFLLQLGAIGIDISIAIAKQLSALPFSSYWAPTPTVKEIILYYAIILIPLSLWHRKKKTALLILGAVMFLLITPQSNSSQKTTVSILDVGQGSATVLELPGNHTILVDGGHKQKGRLSFNIGEQIIAPFLWSKQIRKIDDIIITHSHADHYNGLPFIIERFRPKRIWINSIQSDEKGFALISRMAAKHNIELHVPDQNEMIYTDNDKKIDLSIIANFSNEKIKAGFSGLHRNEDSRQNNQGLVVSLTHGTTRFLLSGDIETEAEHALLKRDKHTLKSTVLTAPHHGSITSSSIEFLQAVKPKYITISASKYSKGRFPNAAVLARYQRIESIPLNTADLGSIFFTTDGKKLTVSSYNSIQ